MDSRTEEVPKSELPLSKAVRCIDCGKSTLDGTHAHTIISAAIGADTICCACVKKRGKTCGLAEEAPRRFETKMSEESVDEDRPKRGRPRMPSKWGPTVHKLLRDVPGLGIQILHEGSYVDISYCSCQEGEPCPNKEKKHTVSAGFSEENYSPEEVVVEVVSTIQKNANAS